MARKSRKNVPVTTNAEKSKLYNVGLYARLSFEDLRKKQSDSIGNQTQLLLQFAEKQPDMVIVDQYQDTDQTGTNFNRPGFFRLMEDVKNKKINCIVVKDLSRFGRNYKEAGNYLEQVFPFLGVRFIAINDDYDSNTASSDDSLIIPLKNIINESYAKDISKKVRSSYETKRNRGDFCGSFAPYGYTKTGNSLVVDAKAAPIVKRIFALEQEGFSDTAIANILNNDGILPPGRYRFENKIVKDEKYKQANVWYKSTIKRITENTSYLGQLSQGKYKTDLMHGGGRVEILPQNWITTYKTHDPIIDVESFNKVQAIKKERKLAHSLLKHDLPPSSENILKGLIYCQDCKKNMLRRKVVRADNSVDYYYYCATYEEVSKSACTKKSICESKLFFIIHAAIFVQIETMLDISTKDYSVQQSKDLQGEIDKLSAKLAKISAIRGSLYEDYCDKTLSKSDYVLAKSKYETDQKILTSELENLTHKKQPTTSCSQMMSYKIFAENKKLNRKIVLSLIEKITIGNYNQVSITFKCKEVLL